MAPGSRDNPDPRLIVKTPRIRKTVSDSSYGESAVTAIEALVDRIDALFRALPTDVAKGTRDPRPGGVKFEPEGSTHPEKGGSWDIFLDEDPDNYELPATVPVNATRIYFLKPLAHTQFGPGHATHPFSTSWWLCGASPEGPEIIMMCGDKTGDLRKPGPAKQTTQPVPSVPKGENTIIEMRGNVQFTIHAIPRHRTVVTCGSTWVDIVSTGGLNAVSGEAQNDGASERAAGPAGPARGGPLARTAPGRQCVLTSRMDAEASPAGYAWMVQIIRSL
ncbi:hypothetical protein DFH09DRAFT_1466708 [Mycena vulgaris]|nr:hypothetical protein DFH09DRAFT_1466708 [Mycena vulgaris]